MSWTKREAVTNLVILGDAEGNAKKIAGLLIGTPADKGYPDKVNYEIVKKDGEVVILSGSASLARQINSADVGKFIKCEFTGWGKSPNGKFKAIDVNVWEGDVTPEMKAWPMYADFKVATIAQKKAEAPAKVAANSAGDFEEFPSQLADEEDDLPF